MKEGGGERGVNLEKHMELHILQIWQTGGAIRCTQAQYQV